MEQRDLQLGDFYRTVLGFRPSSRATSVSPSGTGGRRRRFYGMKNRISQLAAVSVSSPPLHLSVFGPPSRLSSPGPEWR
jgi:hypothetical protein